MKIRHVRAIPVRVPITRPATFSRRQRTAVSATIVEVETDDGLVGVGETRGEWAAPIINDQFAPTLHGLPIDHREAAFERIGKRA